MALKAILESLDDVPSELHEHYREEDGKFILDLDDSVNDHPTVANLKSSFEKQKQENRKLRDRAAKAEKQIEEFGDVTPETMEELQQELEDLRAKRDAGEIGDDPGAIEKKVQEIVEQRLEREKRPIQRELEKATKERDELQQTVGTKEERIKQFVIDDAVSRAADTAKVVPSAKRDILLHARSVFDIDEDGNLIGKDDGGADPDLTPDKWLEAQREDAPHWFPQSTGGGAEGGGGGVPGAGPKVLREITSGDDISKIASGEAVRAE